MTDEIGTVRSVGRYLGVAVIGAVVVAVLFNQFMAPPLARWFFAKTPVEELVELDERRNRATRKFVTSFIAGLMAPPADTGTDRRSREESKAAGGGEKTGSSPQNPGGARTSDSEREKGSRHAEGEPSEQQGRSEESGGENGEPSGSAEEAEVPSGTPEYTLDRGELNERLEEPKEVRNQITAVSNRDGPTGLRFVNLEGYYGQFGLQPGDVVSSINGQSVSTRRDVVRYLIRTRRQTTFRVEVVRAGETFEIEYEVPRKK